ncbi:polysaccharide deacetylase family protein [Aquicella lusitana]|uniref:Peptidoglycan/xylan/chitin deacetylase (PgdA/CDA1 family) n=1 Tax=Aquicella lusitana TaxID=254246 RepID=A0A370GLE5_9COXI|nr:polysaccharide deacetylase family protein [Aquicella lusitana]RDI44608.1 peptidoglycan/xylan/chitin deacetylase (PgdA/CDA1 family) [Aquicella lusitana]VVC72450.1 Peptidoglycan-N-acetylglucosamine deacetylase [Aquicella lusitana]
MAKWYLAFLFILLLPFTCYAEGKQAPLTRTKPLPGTVALTFDDGPNPIYTPQILAILKKYNIKATFFVVGANAKLYPDMVKAIYEQGHVVASHSMTHPKLTKLSNHTLQYEVATPNVIVEKIIGKKPLCLRYPFGMSNEHVREVIRANGMMPVSMGFNSFDYERPGTQKIIDWISKNIYPQQVFLFHDGYDKREQTVAALPAIIEAIKKKGLGFSTICG